jgi:hypothetical protein
LTNQIRRHAPGLGFSILIGFLLRLFWIISVHPDPTDGRFDDTAWYRGAAHFIANGDGYVNPYVGTPTAGWPPGYPYFLGAVFSVFGEGITATAVANLVLSLATIVIVYAIAAVLFDRATATIAAVALAAWPGQIYFTSLTLSEPLFTFLFALAFLLMVIVSDNTRWRASLLVGFGFVLALAALTRGQALILLPIAVITWGAAGYRWRPAIGWAMLAALIVATGMAPWVVRNERELGSPVLLATNFGPNLWIGNHDGATGRMNIPEVEPPQPERGEKNQSEFEVAADRLALRKGLGFMLTHPADEVSLSLVKVRAMYESDATALDWNAGYQRGYYRSQSIEDGLRDLANGFWFAALPFAAVGLLSIRVRVNSMAIALPLLIILWTAMHLLFFGDSRFHYPIVFVFAILGARGVVAILDAARRPLAIRDRGYAST